MKLTKLCKLTALMPVMALAACGGGSTGGSSFEQISTKGLNLVAEYGNTPVTQVSSMPTGTATYRGVAAFSSETSNPNQIIQTAQTVSEIEIVADFSNSTLSGRAYNFKVSEPTLQDITMSGEVAITNGVISQNQLTADISGTLTERAENRTLPVSYSGTVTGNFVGENAAAAIGTGSAVGSADLSPYGGSANFTQTSNIVWGTEKAD